eukprot:1157459-Pelagomonas_calceolata.AAC.7
MGASTRGGHNASWHRTSCASKSMGAHKRTCAPTPGVTPPAPWRHTAHNCAQGMPREGQLREPMVTLRAKWAFTTGLCAGDGISINLQQSVNDWESTSKYMGSV